MKPKRIEDDELLQTYRDKPCFVCNKPPPSDAHHLTSRGAGGGDILGNVIALCRPCHVKYHQYGLSKFCWKYPRLKEFLTKHKRFDLLDKINEIYKYKKGGK